MRAQQAVTAAQAQTAFSVHLSTTGEAMAAVVGAVELAATSRTQATSHATNIGARNSSRTPPVPQLQTIQRIVEQVTGKRIGGFSGIKLGPMAALGGAVGGPASTTDPAAALGKIVEANRLMRYAASGTVTAADGARIGFTVMLTLESRLADRQSVDVNVSHVGVATPTPEPAPKPEVDYGGTGSDLEGQGFRFRFKADPNPAGQPRLMGTGLVVFEKAVAPPTVEDVKAALRGMQVI
ncbi:hypothetical protein [Azohydromonas australica]|uniref:hypothetical protein n=1 Tax=Azohydromonas australica TaxID=364039 RepID=UPI0012EBFE99|nr:hypothetical protein [Azohydromonas australica]